MFDEALLDEFHQSIVRALPDIVVEDFNFDGTVVAGGFDGQAEAAEFDDAVAHHRAAHEDAGERHGPVGDVEAGDAAAGTLDLGVDFGVPPDMEGVDDDAGGGAGEGIGHVVGLAEGDDDGALGRVHGVERLDAESDVSAFGVGEDFAEAIEDGGAGVVEGLAVGGAADDDEDVGAEGGGLFDGETVVGDARAALGGGGRGEPAAATEAGDAQARTADEGGGFGYVFEFMAPDADVWDVVRSAFADGALKRPGVGGHLVEAEAGEEICRVAHATPARARKALMR